MLLVKEEATDNTTPSSRRQIASKEGQQMNKLATIQKRLIRELMKNNTDIQSFEDIGAEGMIALDLLNEKIDFEIYLELINAYIQLELLSRIAEAL
jgi:hypothetical protein